MTGIGPSRDGAGFWWRRRKPREVARDGAHRVPCGSASRSPGAPAGRGWRAKARLPSTPSRKRRRAKGRAGPPGPGRSRRLIAIHGRGAGPWPSPLGRGQRQPEADGGAAPQLALHAGLAAVRLHHLAGDEEPQPGALDAPPRVGGPEEALEDLRQLVGRGCPAPASVTVTTAASPSTASEISTGLSPGANLRALPMTLTRARSSQERSPGEAHLGEGHGEVEPRPLGGGEGAGWPGRAAARRGRGVRAAGRASPTRAGPSRPAR